jgi:pyruvate dehydrogenase E2 component (dihydrolipoamide acetyltransferase)
MATEFLLPDIGEGLTEASIVHWFVDVGQRVEMDQPLVELETDKAVVEFPAPEAGVLLHQGGEAGDVLEVGGILAVVGEAGEVWSPGSTPSPAEPAPIVGTLDAEPETLRPPPRAQVLPRVRRLAEELGVELDGVVGGGPGGRVTEDDVRGAAIGDDRPSRRVPLSATRRAIVRNLTRSWQEIPHVTTYGAADAASLLERRRRLGGPPLEALLIEAVIPVLREFPAFNATFQGDAVVERLHYDIGFAVDSPDGLLVAVLRDADTLDLADLGDEVTRLAGAARNRTATPDELRGQTFTLSNIGAVGGRYGTPLVPYGTTAILSIGRAEPQAVVRHGEITVASEFPLSLSYDHRVIDGATGRAFLGAVAGAFTGA